MPVRPTGLAVNTGSLSVPIKAPRWSNALGEAVLFPSESEPSRCEQTAATRLLSGFLEGPWSAVIFCPLGFSLSP